MEWVFKRRLGGVCGAIGIGCSLLAFMRCVCVCV